jgi:hypothetical protein
MGSNKVGVHFLAGHLVQLVGDDIMYLFETGFGQTPRPGRRAPKDRVHTEVNTTVELQVPFRTDFKAFRQEVLKAIRKHVPVEEWTKIPPKVDSVEENLKDYHKYYSIKISVGTAKKDFVPVNVNLYFSGKRLANVFIPKSPKFDIRKDL